MKPKRARGSDAALLRQRKFALLRRYTIPDELLPGSLTMRRFRCGKPSCHCADGEGHEAWQFTFMAAGKKRVVHVPKDQLEQVRRQVEAGREFQDAVRDVLAANAELWVLARKQRQKRG